MNKSCLLDGNYEIIVYLCGSIWLNRRVPFILIRGKLKCSERKGHDICCILTYGSGKYTYT